MNEDELTKAMSERVEEVDAMLDNYRAVKGDKFVAAILYTMEVYRVIGMMAFKDVLVRKFGVPPAPLDALNSVTLMLTGRLMRTGIEAIMGEGTATAELEEVQKAGKALADKTLMTSGNMPGMSH